MSEMRLKDLEGIEKRQMGLQQNGSLLAKCCGFDNVDESRCQIGPTDKEAVHS
jgi:hypothetical protein